MIYTLHFGAIIYLTLTVAGLGKNSTYVATLLSVAVIMKRAEEVEGRRKASAGSSQHCAERTVLECE